MQIIDEAARGRRTPELADIRLERSVADTLRVIAAACAERDAAPVKAARRHLGQVYGVTRLKRRNAA